MIRLGTLLARLSVLPLRVVWQIWPGPWTCAGFWLAVHFGHFDPRHPIRDVGIRAILFVGTAMNATVTLANGGFMPVRDLESSASLWVTEANHHRLVWLADIFWGWSAGDVAILTGLAMWAVDWLRDKLRERRARVAA